MFCSWLHDTWASTAKSNKSVQTLQKNLARKIAEINLPIGGVKNRSTKMMVLVFWWKTRQHIAPWSSKLERKQMILITLGTLELVG